MAFELRVPRYPAELLNPDKQTAIPNLFNVDEFHKTAIMVDGPSISASGKIIGERLNFDNLRRMFEQHTDLRIASYFSPRYNPDDHGADGIQRFLDYLSHTRWNVEIREGYYDKTNDQYRITNIGPLLATRMQQLAATGKVDTILVVSNEGDFAPAMETCRLTYGVKFLHLAWSAQSEDGDKCILPSRSLRAESEVSLDIAMEAVAKWMIRED